MPRPYTRWDEHRDNALRDMMAAGCNTNRVAKELRASIDAVRNRARYLGLAFEWYKRRMSPIRDADEMRWREYVCEKRIYPRLTATKNGCLEFTGAKARRGYGSIRVWGAGYVVHRIVLEVELGRVLGSKEFACHKCDNPPCANSQHLFVGTQSDNMQDAQKKQRTKNTFPKGHGARC